MSGRHRRDRVPPHLQDQIGAAEREAARSLVAQAAVIGSPIEVARDEDDPTARVMVERVAAAVESREMRGCRHSNTPQPLWLHAWEHPYVLRCQDCERVSPYPSPVEDRTCDICGYVDPEGTWPSAMLKGSVTILMGRCDNCMPPEVLAEKLRTRRP